MPDLDFDGENMSDDASFLVGVRGSSMIVFFSGSGLLKVLPHLSHLSAMKVEKNKTDFISQNENSLESTKLELFSQKKSNKMTQFQK